MKTLTSFLVILLAGLYHAAPSFNPNDDRLIVTKDFYIKDFIKYKGKHDIVKLLLPLNSLNFEEDDSSSSSSSSEETDFYVFFVEADVNNNGDLNYKGLYSLYQGKAKKLLDNGRDMAASGDDSKLVFFGASDGIYVYDQKHNKAKKYGTVDDSIIAIAKEKTGDVMYILTEDYIVYKVSESGTKKEKLDNIVNAKQIAVDYSDNLFFFSDDKIPYVRTSNGVKKIQGLPENPSSVDLVRPPFIMDDGVLLVQDTITYALYPNGTSESIGFEFKPKALPTAYAPEAALIQYYAYDKKIYEFNIMELILGSVLEELNNYLSDKADNIRTLSKKRVNNHRH
ncbi:unnamed protein product, partial [Brenthis ino]